MLHLQQCLQLKLPGLDFWEPWSWEKTLEILKIWKVYNTLGFVDDGRLWGVGLVNTCKMQMLLVLLTQDCGI